MEFLPDSGRAVPSESGETITRRPRRNHTPAFKAKVALAAIKGGSLTPAEAPLIDAEKLFRQPRPPWTTNGTRSNLHSGFPSH